MIDTLEDSIHRAVGMSDMASLLAVAFKFSEGEDLVAGFRDGTYLADWKASWRDACGDCSEVANIIKDCDDSFREIEEGSFRREYSRLFFTPGANVPVWLYESCFLHRESGIEGVPSLLRTRISLDVERRMKEAGVVPSQIRTEPIDSVPIEAEFLAYLYARLGETWWSRSKGESINYNSANVWKARISEFASEHALRWLPNFMEQVKKQSRLKVYRDLADLGLAYLKELEKDVRGFSSKKAVVP